MNNRYKLLKDLPDLKAGAIFTLFKFEKESRFVFSKSTTDNITISHSFNLRAIINLNEWFEEIVEKEQDVLWK